MDRSTASKSAVRIANSICPACSPSRRSRQDAKSRCGNRLTFPKRIAARSSAYASLGFCLLLECSAQATDFPVRRGDRVMPRRTCADRGHPRIQRKGDISSVWSECIVSRSPNLCHIESGITRRLSARPLRPLRLHFRLIAIPFIAAWRRFSRADHPCHGGRPMTLPAIPKHDQRQPRYERDKRACQPSTSDLPPQRCGEFPSIRTHDP